MARAFFLIAVGPGLCESFTVSGREGSTGETRTTYASDAEGTLAERVIAALERHLQDMPPPRMPVALVLPSVLFSHRRVHTPFTDRRKVAQALPFELENELLEPLHEQVYAHELIPQGEQGALVPVTLIRRDVLEAVVSLCQQYRLDLWRVTSSAHALLNADASSDARRIAVYLGPDEAFVCEAAGNKALAVHSLPWDVPELLPAGEGPPWRTPAALTQAVEQRLTRDETDDPLAAEVEAARVELNRFVRAHAVTESPPVELRGLFAPLLRWDAEQGLFVRTAEGESAPARSQDGFGVAGALAASSEPDQAARGMNFHRERAVWMRRLVAHKQTAVAAAVLLVVLLGVAGTNFYLRTRFLQADLQRLDARIQTMLSRHLEDTRAPATAVRILEQRVEELRQQRQSTDRFEDYHYESMTLLNQLSQIYADFPDVTVETLSANSERLILAGQTESFQATEALKDRVAALERFRQHQANLVHQRSGERITYRITVAR